MTTPDNEVIEAEPIMPRVRGRFALYDLPEGGLHIAYRPDGDETDQHFEVPGHIMKLAASLAEGKLNPMELLKMLG